MTDPSWLALARTRGLVVEERPHVVRAAAVSPGMSEAEFTRAVIGLAREECE